MFTRCALDMPELPLETIPHVSEHFAEPIRMRDGHYVLPTVPGASTSFTEGSLARYRWREPAGTGPTGTESKRAVGGKSSIRETT